jgi:hypothetical protein
MNSRLTKQLVVMRGLWKSTSIFSSQNPRKRLCAFYKQGYEIWDQQHMTYKLHKDYYNLYFNTLVSPGALGSK